MICVIKLRAPVVRQEHRRIDRNQKLPLKLLPEEHDQTEATDAPNANATVSTGTVRLFYLILLVPKSIYKLVSFITENTRKKRGRRPYDLATQNFSMAMDKWLDEIKKQDHEQFQRIEKLVRKMDKKTDDRFEKVLNMFSGQRMPMPTYAAHPYYTQNFSPTSTHARHFSPTSTHARNFSPTSTSSYSPSIRTNSCSTAKRPKMFERPSPHSSESSRSSISFPASQFQSIGNTETSDTDEMPYEIIYESESEDVSDFC